MTDTDAERFWDDLYGARAQVWSGTVNAALARRAEALPPGAALDLGCGEGGDALWLAERGWAVTALDISETALARGRAEAERRGLEVDWRRQDLADALPDGPYDLVSAHFLHSPVPFARTAVLRSAAALVATGGHLLVVGHAAPPPWSDHQPDPELMPSADRVLQELDLDDGWEVLECAHVARPATGPDHQHAELVDSVVLVQRR